MVLSELASISGRSSKLQIDWYAQYSTLIDPNITVDREYKLIQALIEIADITLLIAGFATVASGLIQGYSGFGGGLVIVPILAILFNPLEAIAIAAVTSVASSFLLVPKAVRQANWRETTPVGLAIAVFIPLGLMFLISADPVVVRHAIGGFTIVAAIILASGWTYGGPRGTAASCLAGALAGGVTGGFGVPGGPFLVVYFMSSPDPARIQRANIIISTTVAIGFLFGGLILEGVFSGDTLARSLVLVPIFLVSSKLGKYLFEIAPANWFGKVTYGLLFGAGIAALVA